MSVDLHHLIAPYALDALEADDRSRFEAHLASCEHCRVELVGFLSTAARLGEGEAATPPPALRERLVAMADSTTQEHPVVTALAHRSRIRRVAPRLALVAAVAAAVLGIGGFVAEHQRADELSADRSHMVAVMSAEDARTTVGKVAGGGTVRVIASPDKDAAVLVGTALSNLDADRTYQVWRMHDGRPTSVGLMGRGSGVMYVDGIKGADAFAVTVEPSGGSPKPTSVPVVATPI